MKKIYLLTGILCFVTYLKSLSQCSVTNATTCSCAQSGSTNCDLLPDLIVAKPPLLVSGSAGIIEYSQSGNGSNDGRLRVSVSTPNIGYGPLEIHADTVYICGTDTFYGTAPLYCPVSGLPPKQLVNQWVYHKNGNVMTHYQRAAGSMTYHPSHGHMHVDDWGLYTLRTATANPNPLTWPIIGTGAKLAFCLEDYGSCSGYPGHCVDSAGNTLFNPNFPNFGLGGGSYSCSPIVQGISSGYTDIYYQNLDGMYITIPPGTCNGNYYIVVQLDPYNYFLESNENNNVIAVPFTLTLQGGTVPVITANGPTTFCPGGNVTLTTGAATAYLWSTGETTQNISVNSTGSYTVTVTSTTCSGTSQPINILATAPVVAVTPANASVCAGSGIQLNATATTAAMSNAPISFTNNTVINIPDNNTNGVTSSISVSGINPSALLVNSVVSVTVDITHTYDGDLILSLISPSGNQVLLSNRHGSSGDNYQNTQFSMNFITTIASGSAPFAGNYLPDGNLASFTGSANGTWQLKVADVDSADIGTINSWTLQIESLVTNGLSYSWTSLPAGFTSSSQNPTVFPGTGTIYTVMATDIVTGCTGTATASVILPAPLTVSAIVTHVKCAQLNTGAINITVIGGTSPYHYIWNTGATTEDVSSLTFGTYTVTITDTCGVSVAKTKSINIQPGTLSFSASLTNVTCTGLNNGMIDIHVSGGSLPYQYAWSTGATTEDISSLAPGSYTVTITDNCGVTLVKTKTISKISYPYSLSLSKTNVNCPGTNTGIATVAVNGGTAPFSYSWSTNPVLTTSTINGLHWGSYTVIVTDANGCTKSGTVSVNNATYITAVITQTDVSFPGGNNGSASLAVSGGTGPYTYSWNTIPVQTTAGITGLIAGVYKCTITDSKLCTKKITVTITQPPAISQQIKAGSISLKGNLRITPNPSGGITEIFFNAPQKSLASISILDLIGKMVYSCEINLVKGNNNKQLDLRNLPKGIYFIQFEHNSEKCINKLILQ